jgi:hypothetical protein
MATWPGPRYFEVVTVTGGGALVIGALTPYVADERKERTEKCAEVSVFTPVQRRSCVIQ